MQDLLNQLSYNPLVGFTLLLLVVLTIPPVFERLRLPGLVGLLVAGVALGDDGLGLLRADSETMKLFSDIGKIFLMFVAGLEIDLTEFRNKKERSMGFGLATFLIPLTIGTLVGLQFDLGLNASVLLGSLLASHTLLGYPIVQRLGLVTNEAITVTIGATIFTDIAALLVLAICVAINAGEFSAATLVIQLGALGIYAVLLLFGLDWAGKAFFRRTGDAQGNQFLFVLLSVFLASGGAQLINVDKIVGAFLAGLAVNDVLGDGPVKEKIEFIGGVLFIPFFFVGMGLLLDVDAFIATLTGSLGLTLAIVLGLVGGKLLAALVAKGLYRYRWPEVLSMWSLSLPQVAATLAAALAGVEVGLISTEVFNAVIVLMVVTSLLGPVLTERFAHRIPMDQPKLSADPIDTDWHYWPRSDPMGDHPFTVLVPIANPMTERFLIEMGAILTRRASGVIIPLSIAPAHAHMDAHTVEEALRESHRRLEQAVEVSQEFQATAKPQIRIDDDVAEGISRTAREQRASLILMGWSETGLRARLLGSVVDSVFWASHCPVAVMRLMEDPIHIHQVLVPLKVLTPRSIQTVRFAQLFADVNEAEVTLLHVYDHLSTAAEVERFQEQLTQILKQAETPVPTHILCQSGDNPAQVILQQAQSMDMVVLRSIRRRTAGGLAVSDVTTQVISELRCSMVLFGDPHS